MFRERADTRPSSKAIFHWLLLAFNSGFINAGGFLGTGRFVTHVTGFATLFGVDIVNRQYEAALGILSVPIFFIFGSFAAGMLIDRQIHKGKTAHYDWVMLLCAACLLVASLLGEFVGGVGFGENTRLKQTYLLLILLCGASGLQNGAITTSSSNTVRSTHLTGMTTDLGLGFARIASFSRKSEVFRRELRLNSLRFGSIGAYVVGSSFGAYFFFNFGHHGFLLPAVISLYAAFQGYKAKHLKHQG